MDLKKWQLDLQADIRNKNKKDDIDDPRLMGHVYEKEIPREFSKDNEIALTSIMCVFNPRTILEIGVDRNFDSSTKTILKFLGVNNFKYLGVDLLDKSSLNNEHVYTIQCNSSEFDKVNDYRKLIGIESFDMIFIDGWHSINQVLDDWEYTRALSMNGVVVFHDTAAHPGPNSFLKALRSDKWVVEVNMCPDDYGLGYCYEKIGHPHRRSYEKLQDDISIIYRSTREAGRAV